MSSIVKYDSNALWVALSEYSDRNIFHVYSKILTQLCIEEEAARQPGDLSEAEKLVLPSDHEYRLTQYFALVAMQKGLETEDADEKPKINVNIVEDAPEEWAPWTMTHPIRNVYAPPPVTVRDTPGPAWDIRQVLKAAYLLSKPPKHVEFIDEQDMRCVYSLIYDVFRYKNILEQIIQDTDFLGDHPEFHEHRNVLWLFLMELARRRWAARPRAEINRASALLNKVGSPYKEIEKHVWAARVHFAASISRIRIKNKAFLLTDLLPPHLREERMSACVNKCTVTGWVNTFKTKKVALLVKRLHELGYSYSNSRQLCAGEYRFDRVCPRFITLRPPADVNVGNFDLIKEGVIVLQEREFCEGASTLCRALRANNLQGVVAQTHASSPRCSAYLAAQLRELAAVLKAKSPAAPATPELGKLVVFGAGDKVESYVGALRELGIEASEVPQSGAHVLIISESVYCDTPTVMSALEGVVAALATPPNSYSAVTDPIDLVCGRGGDLALLEALTESEIDLKSKARVQYILEEQKKTLKTLMSKPQIQLILYETHSSLEAENETQVSRAVAEANRLARERHLLLKKKHRISSPLKHEKEIGESDTVYTESCSSFTDIHSEIDKGESKCEPLEHISVSENQTDRSIVNQERVSTSDPTSPRRPVSSAKSDNKAVPRSRPASTSKQGSRPVSAMTASANREILNKRPTIDISAQPTTTKSRPIPVMPASGYPHDPDGDNPDVFVPDCDLFEMRTLPNLGNGLDINYILDRDGCYLGLIQRKEITRLDAKYMIRVAEERGLFGQSAPAPQQQRRKRQTTHVSPRRRRRKSFEVERVAAPTYASLSRSARIDETPFTDEKEWHELISRKVACQRHVRRQAAATAINTAACTCHARHRLKKTHVITPMVPEPQCRRPFPVVVQEVRLKTVNPQKLTLLTTT